MTQLKHVSARRALALGVLAVVAAVAAATAFATPGSGFITREVVARGTLGPHFKIKLQDSSSPGDVVVQHFVLAPGGYSGWHTHAGPGIVIVEQGTITIEETEGCFVDYPQGSVLFHRGPGHIQNLSNRTTTPVILDTYFFLPAFDPPGANLRVDEPVQTGPCNLGQNDRKGDRR
jgi:quercetin dioxygenase-like cupin family protein